MRGADPPIFGLTGAQAADILDVTEHHVARLVREGKLVRRRRYQHNGLDRDAVEQLALERYKPGHPYWATTVEVATVLGVARERVRQLVAARRILAVMHGGRRYFRRHQVEVIANARESRRLAHRHGG